MLYIWIISLIFYRYTFFTLSPSDLAPPYWINMGAAAISTLAGTMLIAATPALAASRQLLPFLRGFTLLFWATATWWIPMLLILGIWRHGFPRVPAPLRPALLGRGVPPGHVHRLHVSAVTRGRRGVPRWHLARVRLRGARRVVRRRGRHGVAPAPRSSSRGTSMSTAASRSERADHLHELVDNLGLPCPSSSAASG